MSEEFKLRNSIRACWGFYSDHFHAGLELFDYYPEYILLASDEPGQHDSHQYRIYFLNEERDPDTLENVAECLQAYVHEDREFMRSIRRFGAALKFMDEHGKMDEYEEWISDDWIRINEKTYGI